jgi:glutamate synthase (ferredoxin)
MGFIVHIKGFRSHGIIRDALTVLDNLEHRGACGCESNTGDGAGILFQIPHKFFSRVAPEIGISLPEEGDYGVGMIYMPKDEDQRSACQSALEKIIEEQNLPLLGWRDVPTNNRDLGETAKAGERFMRQVFVGRPSQIQSGLAFERALYVVRKKSEKQITYSGSIEGGRDFYFSSFSSRTIVYKGMLLSPQVPDYYQDLDEPDLESALALVHSRFSTNTFPSWERAHPYRYIVHNGEINTLRGNVNWMNARQQLLKTDAFGDNLETIFPIIDKNGSDSQMFDNALEFLYLSGWSLPHAVMMMIPEPWQNHESMSPEKRAFYEFHSCVMEPWDGPASIGFTDGSSVGAVLDRNGLRPSRYYVTKDDRVIMGSEVGAMTVEPENVLYKGRLQPGRMFLVDTAQGRIISDEEIKNEIATEHPYMAWLNDNLINLDDLPAVEAPRPYDDDTLLHMQKAFGYTFEELRKLLIPMARDGREATGSMGNDAPLAVLSDRPQLLYNYFKQLFAQVTNPPIDALREEIITSSLVMLGSEGDITNLKPKDCNRIRIETPILSDEQLATLKAQDNDSHKAVTISTLFNPVEGTKAAEAALERIFKEADDALNAGADLLILSDRGLGADQAALPALLAISGLHHYLVREEARTRCSLILESGEVREVHHFATLIGFGANAINPYLAFRTLDQLLEENLLVGLNSKKALKNYTKAAVKGVIKVLSKMGISTIQSYCGAQIFEAVGLSDAFIDKYFTRTASRIGGVGLAEIITETLKRHNDAYDPRNRDKTLDIGGDYQWRRDGERHLFNPKTVHAVQKACRTGDYEQFKVYSSAVNDQSKDLCTLRGLLEFKNAQPIPIDEVESVEDICKRFKTGAMSYGSISKEAHETLAIAMNRIGGKSNTGEGGEDVARFTPDANGDSRNSAIKQVASGRFGVTSHYLSESREIQIKMAQGAKPGEGGQLPGKKVYPWIAKVRLSTPGVELISPPPHHDIYSIEDLAELIHDLKNANRHARINVKLVSEVGVGTVAAGVAKGHADVILISGHDGGTGASPLTSIKHAGLPWELGLADTHQTLVLNKLRSRVVVETDGQLKTGRDVAIAALLGAEEFGFATSPLVVMGCIMMRVCHLDTCPVGVATQNPELRKKYTGDPDHVVNFMKFMAQELREIMAELGFRTINDMIGRTDKLEMRKAVDHWKAKGLDFTRILHQPDMPADVGRFCQIDQDHGLEKSLDLTQLLEICKPAIEKGEKVTADLPITNTNRVVGTITGYELTKRHGADGLPDNTIQITFRGSAGQSFGAFMPRGMTFRLEGDANDYFGKGLSGGKMSVKPPAGSSFVAEENVIIGNVAFYGATSGEAYVRGLAGERFCVRNSGVHAVVEGVGDHGCEYMTGGRVVVLGPTGRNFAAGMSGGVAYVYDKDGNFESRCNTAMSSIDPLDAEDLEVVKEMITRHQEMTDSDVAEKILETWNVAADRFVKVMPHDYKAIVDAMKRAESNGMSPDDAALHAFKEVVEGMNV